MSIVESYKEQATATKKFLAYIKGIKKNDKIAILYHPDGDGLCAAVIAAKALERLERAPKLIFTQKAWQIALTPETQKKLQEKKINRLIILDLAADQCPSCVKNAEKTSRVLILDHHIQTSDVNSKRTVMIKAQTISELSGDKYPASKLCFDMFSKIKSIDISDLDWIAAVGTISDKGKEWWKEFLREISDKYAVNMRRFDELEELLDCSRCFGGRINETFKIFSSAAKMSDVLENEKLQFYKRKIKTELDYYIRKRNELAEFYPGAQLIWYLIEPKYTIKSKLANDLSIDYYKNWTVIIVTKNSRADVSARRQDRKISMHELMKKALENIPNAAGGGHVPAAGAILPEEYLQQFKENVIAWLKLKTETNI